jgi:hypothetical protein
MIRPVTNPFSSYTRRVRVIAFVRPFCGRANRVARDRRGVVPSEPSYEGVRHG